jgi:hypothetical protein
MQRGEAAGTEFRLRPVAGAVRRGRSAAGAEVPASELTGSRVSMSRVWTALYGQPVGTHHQPAASSVPKLPRRADWARPPQQPVFPLPRPARLLPAPAPAEALPCAVASLSRRCSRRPLRSHRRQPHRVRGPLHRLPSGGDGLSRVSQEPLRPVRPAQRRPCFAGAAMEQPLEQWPAHASHAPIAP